MVAHAHIRGALEPLSEESERFRVRGFKPLRQGGATDDCSATYGEPGAIILAKPWEVVEGALHLRAGCRGVNERAVGIVGRIEAVPTILDTVCRVTGMGFAAVGQVTASGWVDCTVRDDISFGLKAGGDLKLDTTI